MPVSEIITPILPPTPQLPNPLQFKGTVMLRCGPVGGPYRNLQLPANPDQEIVADVRVTLIQTVSGAYFDDFGLGIPRLVLTGDTAWVSPQGMYNGEPRNGYQVAQHLYRDILQYYFQSETDTSNPQNMELLIFDYTNNSSWSVKPLPPGMTLQRTKASPMTYSYSVNFVVNRDLINDAASPGFKPGDPVQQLIVGLTDGQGTAQQVNQTVNAAQGASQAPVRTYTVVSGDSLWRIAAKPGIYNDGSLWHLIYDANKSIIRNPNLIFPGQVLTIPPRSGANRNAA